MKKHTKKMVTALAILFCALFLTGTAPISLAAGLIDTENTGSISLHYVLPDVQFCLYRVADVSTHNRYALCGDFAAYPVDLSSVETTSDWLELATTLQGYVARDAIAADAQQSTDEAGNLNIDGLPVGLYLILGDDTAVDYSELFPNGETMYHTVPFILQLPSLDAEDIWQYEIAAEVKYNQAPTGSTQSLTVYKYWDDKGFESKRTDEIIVQLLRNETIAEEVVLNAANGWTKTWDKLDAGFTWTIVEKEVPKNYTVAVQNNENIITLTNTYHEPNPDKTPAPSGGGSGDNLAKTGQLWWPIPILAIGGILFFAWGWLSVKKKKEEENA